MTLAPSDPDGAGAGAKEREKGLGKWSTVLVYGVVVMKLTIAGGSRRWTPPTLTVSWRANHFSKQKRSVSPDALDMGRGPARMPVSGWSGCDDGDSARCGSIFAAAESRCHPWYGFIGLI